MIYLASPYSHPDAAVREQRFHAACRAAAALLRAGRAVFSPVVHGHPLVAHGLPTDWPFWQQFGRAFLSRCDELVILTLDGWRESDGVREEVRLARDLGKPILFLGPEEARGSPTSAHVAPGVPR